MFSPFGFMATKAVTPGDPYPPYSPYAFYDANNATYSSLFYAYNVVNGDADVNQRYKGTGTSNSGSDSYDGTKWTYNKIAPRATLSLTGSAANSDFLKNIGNTEHTIVTLSQPLQQNEEDIVGASPGDSGAYILGFLNNGGNIVLYGQVWNSLGQDIRPDVTGSTTVGQWHAASQRLDYDGAGSATLSVFLQPSGSAILSGSATATYTSASSGNMFPNIAGRSLGTANFSGSISQVAFYDKVLTNSEIEAVHDWMLNHQTY